MPIGVYERKPRPAMTDDQRAAKFWRHVVKSDGCWEWSGLMGVFGYGRFVPERGGEMKAHRFSWILHNGAIPKGCVIMHSCDNRRCVNPEHLSVGSQRENIQDASRKRRLPNQNKTHCSKGHPLTGDNVRPRYDHNGRACVTCARESVLASNRARRARGLR